MIAAGRRRYEILGRMTKLRGRRVAITGGAQGIGRAIGEALIAAGAAVALGDVQEAAVRQTGTEIGPGATTST